MAGNELNAFQHRLDLDISNSLPGKHPIVLLQQRLPHAEQKGWDLITLNVGGSGRGILLIICVAAAYSDSYVG